MATNSEMKIEFSYFGEVWTLFKKFYDVQQSDEFWGNLISEASEIDRRYSCRLCRNLLISVLDELDRRARDPGGRDARGMAKYYAQT